MSVRCGRCFAQLINQYLDKSDIAAFRIVVDQQLVFVAGGRCREPPRDVSVRVCSELPDEREPAADRGRFD